MISFDSVIINRRCYNYKPPLYPYLLILYIYFPKYISGFESLHTQKFFHDVFKRAFCMPIALLDKILLFQH